MTGPPVQLAVLVSGSGTTLQNLIDQIAAGDLPARIALVIASRAGIFALDRAHRAGIASVVVDRRQFPDIAAFSENIFAHCHAAGAELVCLAGWLSLLRIPTPFVRRVMNIHPALLPDFGGPGMYGTHVHEAVLAQRRTTSGCTVHWVDDLYDHGEIILQRTCPVLPTDTPPTLAARVFEQEKIAYPQAISMFQRGER